jgi:protein-S-isoprenylcysteine O-methyltransferase Ste14
MFFVVAYLVRRDPDLLERRMRMREKEREQGFIVWFCGFFMLAALILPGFDKRFGWSSVPPAVAFAALTLVLAGYGLISRVFRENSYASRIVEVAASQTVISTGPYRMIRHPMYAGVLLMYISTPLALGSAWAVLPALAVIPGILLRISSEERVLAAELAGYRDYMDKVRFRLIPGVW